MGEFSVAVVYGYPWFMGTGMGTAKGSPMWLGGEWASNREWSKQLGQGSREDQRWGEKCRESTLVP